MKKLGAYLPSLLTGVNITVGTLAILLVDSVQVWAVALLIAIGAGADFFDGFFARKMKAATDFGKQLDSLADIITFGIAPLRLIWHVLGCGFTLPLLAVTIIYMCVAAYRLARFNISGCSCCFQGLPITAAGVGLIVWSLLCYYLASQCQIAAATYIFMLLLAVAMASKLKIKKPLGKFNP